MKRALFKIVLPWLVTCVALCLAFKGVEWDTLAAHAASAKPGFIIIAIVLTCLSYVIRALRWPLLFPKNELPFISSYKVLVLGFFMNNILPARAGELVRAHLGSKVTGEPRTLVLATVASERLADGLAISILFASIILIFGRGHLDPEYAKNLLFVAYLFVAVAVGVLIVLGFRTSIFSMVNRLETCLDHKASTYTLTRIQYFIDGLTPLCSPERSLKIAAWSAVIWGIELGVFSSIAAAFNNPLPLSGSAIFLAAVNFSSLVPAAPGGIGVIEFFTKNVLMSLGVESNALALCMALGQHIIQYAVIGIPGAFLLATLGSQISEMRTATEEQRG